MQTVGELLREEREKKGLSIKEIENATSIRTLYITAIEEGNYNLVPGEVYLKGFIRNYANYLGLDGQKMVNSYRQTQIPSPPITADVVPNIVEKPSEESSEKSAKNSNNSGKWLIISLLAVCVTGSAWWLLSSPKPAKEPIVNNQIQPTPVIPNQPAPAQPITPTTTPQAKPVVVTAKYTEQCWTSVIADGKNIYEGTPQSGDTLTWEAQKSIAITAGNAGGIDIIFNGQSVGKIGGKGEVVIKNFVAK